MVRTAVLLAGLLGAPSALAGPLTVQVNGLDHARGRVVVALFRNADGFPTEASKATRIASVPAEKPATSVRFPKVPPGVYALFAVHDEDGDGEIDHRWMSGRPSEPTGASNNPGKAMPRFSEASFRVGEAPIQLKVGVKRW